MQESKRADGDADSSVRPPPRGDHLGALLDREDARERLEALAILGGIPAGLFLSEAAGGGPGGRLDAVFGAPLGRLIDGSNPDERPCEAALLALCREVLTDGTSGTRLCPTRDWLLEAWPVALSTERDETVLACVTSARPTGSGRVSSADLAARFHLDEDALRRVRLPPPRPDEERRIRLAHRELRSLSRALSERATLLSRRSGPPTKPRPRGRSGRILRHTRPHPVAAAGRIQPLLDAMVLEAVWIVDAEGTIRQANKTCTAWFGQDPVGRSCDDVCGAAAPPCHLCPTRAIGDGAAVGTVQRHALNLSGREVDITVYPLRLEEEEHPAVLLVGRDVTARKRLEQDLQTHAQELAARQAQLELILDCMGEGLLVTDADGFIVQSNPIARMIFGVAPAALEQRHLLDLLPMSPQLVTSWRDLTSGQAERVHEEMRVSGVRPVDLLVTIARMVGEDDDETGGFVASMKDVTRLKELDRLRDDFVANVSHELRTPLATVRGFARTLSRDPDMDPAQRMEFLELIDREGERLGRLIEDILAMARLEGRRSTLRCRPVELGSLVEELTSFFEQPCREARIDLEVGGLDDAPTVVADRALLRQLGHNLLGNALKFTPPGGRVRLSLEPRGEGAVLRVVDTGPGIAEEELPHVFEKFYRAPGSAPTLRGTGLGLAIVKRIVDAHGWNVGLRSERNRGTEVWVEMGLAAPAEA